LQTSGEPEDLRARGRCAAAPGDVFDRPRSFPGRNETPGGCGAASPGRSAAAPPARTAFPAPARPVSSRATPRRAARGPAVMPLKHGQPAV